MTDIDPKNTRAKVPMNSAAYACRPIFKAITWKAVSQDTWYKTVELKTSILELLTYPVRVDCMTKQLIVDCAWFPARNFEVMRYDSGPLLQL
jgi:hypothetical protein